MVSPEGKEHVSVVRQRLQQGGSGCQTLYTSTVLLALSQLKWEASLSTFVCEACPEVRAKAPENQLKP